MVSWRRIIFGTPDALGPPPGESDRFLSLIEVHTARGISLLVAGAMAVLWGMEMQTGVMAPHDQIGLGAFQEMRQAEMAAPVCKAAWTCARAEDVAADLAKAIRLARSGRPGPVHLSLPTDVLEGPAGSRVPSARDFLPEPMPLDPDLAARLVDDELVDSSLAVLADHLLEGVDRVERVG